MKGGDVMKKRYKLKMAQSKAMFSHAADRTHRFNMPRGMPMRGGIRM